MANRVGSAAALSVGGLESLALALVCVGLATGSAAATEEVMVRPGTVLRWPGSGVQECGIDPASWPPRDGVCWYPVDLLREPGPLKLWRRTAAGIERQEVEVADYPYPVQRIRLEDDSRVHLSRENLARANSEQRRVGALWKLASPARFELPLAPPLADLPQGGRFGSRRFFNDEPRSPHSGADYAAVRGTPVLATAGGRVALADDLFFSGQSVFIDHGAGLVSMYFHLSRILVAVGDEVERGQEIGRVGATGRATGPHLHFGLRWRGARVDPAQLLAPVSTIPLLR